MQNFDYYNGNTHTHEQPDFVVRDPEYFSRMARNQQNEGVKKRNKATRFLSLVMGLCIVSFTSGLVVGIKFTGGSEKEIVDPTTRKAMNDIGSRVSGMKNSGTETASSETNTTDAQTTTNNTATTDTPEKTTQQTASRSFPKEIYPYVIRVGTQFSAKNSQEIADYLSSKGHTVIISQHEDFFRVYTGPYKEKSSAESALNRINYYADNKYFHSALVLKR